MLDVMEGQMSVPYDILTNMNTINELINEIYEDNFSHLDFMDNMGGDCDCIIHNTLLTICKYAGIEVNA